MSFEWRPIPGCKCGQCPPAPRSDDRGLEALADRLESVAGLGINTARSILGEHGRFLPDGWPIQATKYRETAEAEAEFERLRRIEAAARAVMANFDGAPSWDAYEYTALRAALEGEG